MLRFASAVPLRSGHTIDKPVELAPNVAHDLEISFGKEPFEPLGHW